MGLYFYGTLRRRKPVTDEDHKYLKYWLERLAEHGKAPVEETRYGVAYLTVDFDLYDPASLSQWHKCRNNNSHESFRVSDTKAGNRPDLIRRVNRIVANRNRPKLVQPAAVSA